MSLATPDVVDVVTTLPNDPRIVLIAHDGGEVPEPSTRETALHRKLDAYLKFVVSGQFARTYPEDADREVCIVVICVNLPTEGMKKIHGIRDHRHPETFIPVEVITQDDFRARLGRA